MVVTEFTYEQAKKLIDTPKVILESDGKTVCKQKQIKNMINVASAILAFARYINVRTPITAQQSLI